jgi:hypothetical protein
LAQDYRDSIRATRENGGSWIADTIIVVISLLVALWIVALGVAYVANELDIE